MAVTEIINNQKEQEAVVFFGQRFQDMDMARRRAYDRFEIDEKLFRSHLETSRKADWQCVSEDTEILSLDGWKKMGEIKNNDNVLSFDIKTGYIKNDVVSATHEYKLNNEMAISICNNKTDQLITLNHRVLTKRSRKTSKLVSEKRQRVWDEEYQYIQASDLIPADSMGAIEYRIPVSGLHDGDLSVGEDVAELIGWFLSDGCIPLRKSNRPYITQSKPETKKELIKLLNRLSKNGLEYREWSRKKGKRKNGGDYFNEHRFYIPSDNLIMKKILELIPGRLPSNKLFRLKLSEKNRLLNGIFLGDGSKRSSDNKFSVVDEPRKKFQDWFQTMMHLSGYRCRIGKGGKRSIISHKKTLDIYGKRHIKELKYTGRMWSITTTRSNYIARRNGKIFITGNSQYFIPRTYGLVMASLSEFAINKPDVVIEPDTRNDALRVPYMRAVMQANWKKNKGNAELLFVLLDALKLGIGILEVGYRKDKREIKDIQEYDPSNEKFKWKKKDIFDFDDVYFETVNPRYFWISETAKSISEADDCVRRYIYSEESFHQIFDSKFPKAKKIRVKGDLIKEEFFKPFLGGEDVKSNEINVFRYYNKNKDVLWWIANGTLLNDPEDPIPFHHKKLPYAEVKLAPIDKYSFYGMSLPRMIEGIQHELNTLRNMVTDQTHLNIFSPFFYSAEEDLDESIFTIEPGVGIPVTDPNSFSFFKQGAVGSDAYRMMDLFDDDARQATGFDLRLQGLQGGGTATETAILKETALKRINLYLRFMEDFSMPDFAELWKDTIQQFYFTSSETKKRIREVKKNGEISEREELFRSIKIPKSEVIDFRNVEMVQGFNFLNVTPKDIRGVFDAQVRIGSSISISKELSKQVKLQLYGIMAGEPLIKREKLVVDVLKAHEMDPEEYMTTGKQVDIARSIALAEEHNKQMLAGQDPGVIPDLITPEHIQVHDVFIKSGNLDSSIKRKVIQHAMEEMRTLQSGGAEFGIEKTFEKQLDFGALERTPELGGRLIRQPGLPREVTNPRTAAEISSRGVAPNKPVVRP